MGSGDLGDSRTQCFGLRIVGIGALQTELHRDPANVFTRGYLRRGRTALTSSKGKATPQMNGHDIEIKSGICTAEPHVICGQERFPIIFCQ